MSYTHQVYLIAGWKISTDGMPAEEEAKFDALVDFYHEEADQSKHVIAISDQMSGKYYLIGHVIAELDPEDDAGEKVEIGNYNRDMGEEYSLIEAVLPDVKRLMIPEDMELFLISHVW